MTPSSPPSYTFLDTQPYPLLTSLASKLPNSSTNIPHQTSSPTAPPITDPNQSPTHTGPNSPGPTFPTNQPTCYEPHNTQTQNSPLPPPIFDPPNPQTNTDPVNEPPRTHPMITRSQSGIVKPIDRLSLHTFSISPIPKNPSHALKDPNWRNAMYDEYNALVKNGTWLLVPRPAGVNMVRSMWLFKHKFHADGTLSRYKARLVANGSSQKLGVDFDKTFSPVVKPAAIRMVLSLAVSRQWPIHQLDIKNDFFNGDLTETVYMHQPPGFVDNRYPHHVCRLQRSLYGLKQAPRAWFQRFAGYATRAGFYHSRCDSSLFIYRQGSQVAYLLIYVYDIILTASCPALLQQIIGSLNNEFDMTDLGALNYFLGISADRTPTGLFLSQKKYALQLLERAHMVTCNPSPTPVDTESKLGPEGVPVQDPTLYRSLAGGAPGTLDLGIHLYASSTTSLVGYTDADWAGCPSTRSAEAEYRGVANIVAETAWLRNLLRELHSPLSTATLVYCDNVSAVYMYVNPVQHQRTKHIEIDIHFVRDMVTAGQACLILECGDYVSARKVFDKMFVRNVYSWNGMINGYVKGGMIWAVRGLFERMRMRERDVVTWNTMVVGYECSGMCAEAVKLFKEFRSMGVELMSLVLWQVFKYYSDNVTDDGLLRMLKTGDNTGDGGEQSEDSEGTVVKEPHEENSDGDADGGIDDETMFRMDSTAKSKFRQVEVLDLLLEALKPFVSVNKSERTVVPGKKMISGHLS
ncbi:ribonuclease H-like domain-containing protein [Tanacetum coccineum]